MSAMQTTNEIRLKNVLYATDFSRPADAAFPYAAEFARRFGAKFYAVHVRTPDNYLLAAPESWSIANAEFEKQENALRAVLRCDLPHLETEVMAVEGGIWPALESVIHENQIDLLVLGTHGRTGIKKFLLGSVAEEIVRRATCPVLTVGPHSLSGPPLEGRFHEILYATDFSEASVAAAPYVAELSSEHHAQLTLLHVVRKFRTGEPMRPDEIEADAIERMQHLIPEKAALWSQPRYAVREGDPAEAILEEARGRKADLIVLGVRKPSSSPERIPHLLAAITHKVIAQAACPVLTVRS